jgi:hypothetical protein
MGINGAHFLCSIKRGGKNEQKGAFFLPAAGREVLYQEGSL